MQYADTLPPQEVLWEEPWTAFTEEERASAETFQDSFYLELFDAVGGGLICRHVHIALRSMLYACSGLLL